jgi:NADH:ubiquinone oxidoreductase subunit 2 (subunit N)
MGIRPQLVVSDLLMGIPSTVGFRPQLVVVSGLLVGIPLTVGFRSQFVVVSGLSVGIPLTVGFRLSRSHRVSWSPFTIFPFS